VFSLPGLSGSLQPLCVCRGLEGAAAVRGIPQAVGQHLKVPGAVVLQEQTGQPSAYGFVFRGCATATQGAVHLESAGQQAHDREFQ